MLDGLRAAGRVSNQTLKAQEAAFRQAVAAVAEARAQLFPTVGVTTCGPAQQQRKRHVHDGQRHDGDGERDGPERIEWRLHAHKL